MKNVIPTQYHKKGFTLIELIIAMAILAIVTRSLLGAFTKSQARGRDAQRKSDLKQLQNAFEAYANDNQGKYPNSDGGKILGCPADTGTACTWGEGRFGMSETSEGAIYMIRMVKDPRDKNYFYMVLDNNTSYKIYACLENEQDLCFKPGNPNCSELGFADTSCGPCGRTGTLCNYGVASSNEKLE